MKFVSRVRLFEKYDSSFCPFCRKELKAEGKDFREFIKPMWKNTWVEECQKPDGSVFELYTYTYSCDRECCRNRQLTEHDIVKANTERFDGTKWDEKSKPFTFWNDKTKKWEERVTERY